MGAWEGIWKGMEAVEDAKYKGIQLDLQERKQALFEKEYEDNAQSKLMDSFFKKNQDGYKYNKTSTNSGPEIKTGMEYLTRAGLSGDIVAQIVSTNNSDAMKKSKKLVDDLRQIHENTYGVFNKEVFVKELNEEFNKASITSANQDEFYDNIITLGKEAGLDVEDSTFISTAESMASSRQGSAMFSPATTPKVATPSEIKTLLDTSNEMNLNNYNNLTEDVNKLLNKTINDKVMSEEIKNVYQADFANLTRQLKPIKKSKFLLNNTFNNANKEAILETYPYFRGNKVFNNQFSQPNPQEFIDLTSRNTKDPYFFVEYLAKNNLIPIGFNFKIFEDGNFVPISFTGVTK